jgi:hypothetical protein
MLRIEYGSKSTLGAPSWRKFARSAMSAADRAAQSQRLLEKKRLDNMIWRAWFMWRLGRGNPFLSFGGVTIDTTSACGGRAAGNIARLTGVSFRQ